MVSLRACGETRACLHGVLVQRGEYKDGGSRECRRREKNPLEGQLTRWGFNLRHEVYRAEMLRDALRLRGALLRL